MFSNIITKIKHTILVDETLPKEEIKKQLKAKTYSLLGFSFILSFLLIYLLPEDTMQYNWAQDFVNIMSYIVPSIGDIEYIRVNGPSDETKRGEMLKTLLEQQGKSALPNTSFYYAIMWVYTFMVVPLRLYYDRKHFKYRTDYWFLNYSKIKRNNQKINSIKSILLYILFFLVYGYGSILMQVW
jgi:hypothetical protein